MKISGASEARRDEGPHDRRIGRRRRWVWLLQRVRDERSVDVLNAEFVVDYIREFNAPFRPTFWGAHKCRQLGRDLAEMAKLGYLHRHRAGLAGNWQPGFPTWVWSYQTGKHADLLAPNIAVWPKR